MITEITIGSAPDNDCRILDPSIKPHHAHIIALSEVEYLLHNLNEEENDIIVERQTVSLVRINKFTPIKIGEVKTTLGELLESKKIEPKVNPLEQYNSTHRLIDGRAYLAGASPICDITLVSPRVGWHALEIKTSNQVWHIKSLHSRHRFEFKANESLRVGPYWLHFGDSNQLQVAVANDEKLLLRNVYTTVPKHTYKHTLHDVSLGIRTGEFVGIIGPSGAGKSTLLKALRGLIPIHSGKVTLSGRNFAEHPELLGEIGLVPQDDVVIPELTVEENLMYAARLRLPPDWSKQARAEKVNELLEAMQLQRQRHQRCTHISGGQRKRVNLSLELILEPTFFLADEACSGLSALDSDNILHHLRQLADRGKGVLLTIHSPDIEALDLMDKLLVLDTGGYVAYYGPPLEAMPYFSQTQGASRCRSPKLIFDVLEKKKINSDERLISPEEHYVKFKGSTYYREIEAMLSLGDH